MPQQTYLNNHSLSGIDKVAVVVSVSAPKVSYRYTGYSSGLLDGGAIGQMSPFATESILRYGLDSQHTSKINEHVDIGQIENKTAQSFIQPLKKANLFQSVEQPINKNQDSRQLRTIGYDAVIRLTVPEITINRAPGDSVKLTAVVHGQMECMATGRIVWDREEVVTNPEPHPIDYYKENGLKELDTMLEKATKKLVFDFIYLK
jgi:hypothetical protein